MHTGGPYDSVTRLYYFGARYYDDSIGRFITEDSYKGDDNDPLTLDRYVYARDNPETNVDPSGHVPYHIWQSRQTPSQICAAVQSACPTSPSPLATNPKLYGYKLGEVMTLANRQPVFITIGLTGGGGPTSSSLGNPSPSLYDKLSGKSKFEILMTCARSVSVTILDRPKSYGDTTNLRQVA